MLRISGLVSLIAGLSLPAGALGYEEPLPPPELGEHLASYRTDNQKKGPVAIRSDVKSRGALAEVSGDAGKADDRNLKNTVTDYVFVPNKNVLVYTGGETVLRFTDRESGRPLTVSAVKVSNSGFTAVSDGSAVIVKPTGKNTGAKIRIVLEKRPGYPLIFELSYVRSRHDVRNIENVRI